MKLYRTTKISPQGNEYVRYSKNRQQYSATKGVIGSGRIGWYKDWKVFLDVIDIPEEAWTRVEEA